MKHSQKKEQTQPSKTPWRRFTQPPSNVAQVHEQPHWAELMHSIKMVTRTSNQPIGTSHCKQIPVCCTLAYTSHPFQQPDPTPTWGLPVTLVTPSPHSPTWLQAIPPQAAAPTGSPIERSQPIPAQTERRSRCGCHHLFQRHSAPLPVRLFAISFTLPTLDVSMYSFRGLPR